MPVIVFVANIIAYIFCQIVKDNTWIDALWCVIFAIPYYYIIVTQHMNDIPIYSRKIITIVLITIWAVRLSAYIGIRHKGEDFRHA